MTAIEDRLTALGRDLPTPDLPAAADVMRLGTRRRRRRRATALCAAAVLVAGGAAAVTSAVDGDGNDVRTDRPVPPADAPGPSGEASAPSTAPTPSAPGGGSTTLTPGLRTVPDVVGLTVERATAMLADLGLTVAARGGTTATVESQDPSPGSVVDVGSAVTLIGAELTAPASVDGPVITGTLLDGRRWTVGLSSAHGLCVTLAATDVGCDDVGPVIAPDADPASLRLAFDDTGSFSYGDAGQLAYAFLPPGATAVELVGTAGQVETGELVIEPTARFWAVPVRPGDNPGTVIYRDAAGAEVLRLAAPS